jgi:hypothetical protein
MSRARNAPSVAFENGATAWSTQSNTSCQRRSITVASITSSSLAPVEACRIVARPSSAGGTGGCPTGLSAYMPASSAWKASSNNS